MIKQDNRMEYTESHDFMKALTIPMIVQCVMPSPWCHLSHTRHKRIGGRPSCLDFLSTCSPSPSCITQTETLLAPLAMSVNMPAWNSNVDLCCQVDLNMLREL